ncbi:acyl-CoA dehydrogenase [Desulfosarcina alkanivorans]|jgi:alkylation response protein AidB-like acyl-CoA dehydrogenase|uniref:Acyl-CoA dehydrogenase n=1 Tax=Desulfosarcina alkanivorans TaxID=571177 RepID=A0A5K7YN40_9BACT|nr:acyl-CoA dehydrogenase family protein [Desulfosarcina alkanivorans]BBO69795.1 acyl-CoA dehydrogenase [Desulfosarcina alkanivorans]
MDFKLTIAEETKKQEFEEFFEHEMKNAPPQFGNGGLEGIYDTEEGFAFHKYMADKLAQKGWLSMGWPKKYGGQEASIMEQVIFDEVRGYYNAPGVDGFAVGMFAPTLIAGATEEQKARLLPPIREGKAFYCQGWSEPDAGSDLASLTTTATRKGDYFVVNGQKTWTTGAHRADYMFLLARTDPDSKRGKGLSVFHLKMDRPGIQVRPLLYMNGKHVFNEVFFNDVKIPAEDLIGVEGEGWALTRQTMNFERSGAGGFSGAKRYLEQLIDYVKTTVRNGQPLSKDPNARRKIAKLFIGAEVGKTLAYKIAWMHQKGDFSGLITAASASKLYSTELAQKLANYATEIMGLYGQLEEDPWAPMGGTMTDLYQMSKGATIYAGTNEIQRNLIAWVGLGLPRLKLK